MKPLVRHERADRDVLEAVEHYLQNAPEVTLAFIDSLELTYRYIQRRPGAGSPRYAHELELARSEVLALQAFPLSGVLRGDCRSNQHLARAAWQPRYSCLAFG